MIMIIAIILIFFILCDIWSTVENYFQKIHNTHTPPPAPSLKKSISPFLVPPFAKIENF